MVEKREQKEENQNRCSKCNSTFIYIRIKDKQKVCRKCGNIENIGEVKR